MRNYTDAVDLHSILHIPVEFYVHTLFCIWHSASCKWLDILKNTPIIEMYRSRDMLILLETDEQVKLLEINIEHIKKVKECFGFIVTAPSSDSEYDFVSRFFAPNAGINEDPVTGSSHSTLIPFWAERLDKNKLIAKQLSKRGGTLYCENNGDRVKISGKAKLYLEGEIEI